RIGREGRLRALAEIPEDEPHRLARRIGADAHLAGEPRLFGGLLVALAGAVEFPAVIDAAYVVTFDPAEMHLRAAMRATIVDDLRGAALAAIDREILAHDAD